MIKFGTGGWREIIGSGFTKENVQLVAFGIAELAKKESKADKLVVIGYDNRFLSEVAAKWVAEALVYNGMKVLFLMQSVPTPLVMYMVQSRMLYYGICITASHNPYQYNGIKLFTEGGRDADIETTSLLENIISDIVLPNVPEMNDFSFNDNIKLVANPFDSYINNIMKQINCEAIKRSNISVLLDPMYGSGLYPLNTILKRLNVDVYIIHGFRDAFFGWQDPAPKLETLTELQCKVSSNKCNIGIALDGDGDRLGIIDSNGRYINANEILSMLYWYLHTYKKWNGPVVKNLATTYMLDVIANSFNEHCYEVPIGFKHISAAIDKYDAVLGGESSGGLTVRGHIHGKDSIYAALLFIEMICVTGKSATDIINELEKEYGHFEMVECNLALSEEKMAEVKNKIINNNLKPHFRTQVVQLNYRDGVKFYFEDNSWVICRPSGTEPLLRIFAEASSKNIANEYINTIKDEIKI